MHSLTRLVCFYSVVINNINNRNNNNNNNKNDNNNNQFSKMEASTSIEQNVPKRRRKKRNIGLSRYQRNNEIMQVTKNVTHQQKTYTLAVLSLLYIMYIYIYILCMYI